MAENHHHHHHHHQQTKRTRTDFTPPQLLSPSSPPQNLNLNQPHYSSLDSVSLIGDFLKQRTSESMSTSSVPFGPFTGYASILMRSKFLKPAQQILDEFCGICCQTELNQVDSFGDSALFRDFVCFGERIDRSWMNSKLVFLLEEVYRKYRLYNQQIQSIVASFETVAGLGNAAPYVSTAFKALSKHFSGLKNAIMDQIHVPEKTNRSKNVENEPTLLAQQGIRAANNQKFLQYPVWRSQRGLPGHAVSVLKTWLFENFLHPYPTDADKQMLARQTGLSRTQVSNWFINARVRLWKPMVEEIHKLEKQQSQTQSGSGNLNINMASSNHQPNPFASAKFPGLVERQKTIHSDHQIAQNSSFRNLSSNQQQIGGTTSNTAAMVSLALGLQRNVRTDFSGAGNINIAHNFDLENDVGED